MTYVQLLVAFGSFCPVYTYIVAFVDYNKL